MPNGSINVRKPGNLLARRWPSTTFTQAKVTALNIAMLVQFTGISTHFKEMVFAKLTLSRVKSKTSVNNMPSHFELLLLFA